MQNTFPDCQRTDGAAEDMPEGMTNDSLMCKAPFSLERLHRSAKTSPGLNIDALLSPRDDVRLSKAPDGQRGSMLGAPSGNYAAGSSPPLCRASSVMAAPVSRLGGPSLLSTSPMCMQSTISDLINPEGKRMRTDELDALLNSQKKTRGEGDLLSLVSDGDNITSTPQRLEDTLPLDLKLTPSVDKSKSRSLLGGNLDTFDPSLSGLAALFPSTLQAPTIGRRPELRHSEFVSHITAAVELLNPPEQDRLKSLLRQPTVQGAMESLLSICSSSASDASDYMTGQPQQMHPRDQMMLGNVMPLRMESLAPQGPSDTFTNVLNTYGSSRVSPRVMGAAPGGYTPRDGDSLSGHPSSQQACPMGQPGHPEYGSALLDQLQEAQRAARKRAGYVDEGPLGRLASPRRRKTGPPSSRDRVWDLLMVGEKKQILADQMSAAEGTKILLERRAAQLGCEVVEMTDEDDWDIGFKLTECKATSEPLAKPKNCSICLRNGVVFHRHSYYCRRCAQLYRAIHRKKTTLQNEGHARSQ